ncbi:M14 family metallopeptidase [Pannonibacter indicus]|uniref:M14 family metallopeptidase n=1 Tax=Pannonibacter indicus TaxID=466044 RepID=UPI003919204B
MTSTAICLKDAGFSSTLDRLSALLRPGITALEAWTFDDLKTRRAIEAALAEKGITAIIRSAYKPLVHAVQEEVDLDGVAAAELRYPVHPLAPENRFRLEAYPLAALIAPRPLTFAARTDGSLQYELVLTHHDGSTQTVTILAPNREHQDLAGQMNLSPCGWVKLNGDTVGMPFETPYEALFAQALDAVSSHDWGVAEPWFEELNLAVRLPAADLPLAHAHEVMSLAEAMHEDLYFSLLEFFQMKSGRPQGDRGLKPGQIVPEVLGGQESYHLRIELRPLSSETRPATVHSPAEQDLAQAAAPLSPAQISAELARVGGEAFSASSRAGRKVEARYRKGTDVPVMISAGQHANETTGVVGALRAGQVLAARDGAHFTLSPQENPDGYALHQRLIADNPFHMHHAARYTALGDDLEYRRPGTAGDLLLEKAIRIQAEARTGAQLHVNLHGYPSHEWTRPLSGYVPRHFAMWTLPKGFFLILRYLEGWERQAEDLMDRVTRHLAAIPGLLEENARQIALYEAHAGGTGFRMVNGFPCLCSVDARHTVPVTLITEYPDETIYGPEFITGHTAQMETVLSAYDAWQQIMAVG